MNLVEVLGREWFEWPINHDGPLAQNAHGGIYIPGSFRVDGFDAGICMSVKQADDWRIALVTRAQWEAELNRIAAMDVISASEQSNAEPESGQCTQYEQELWDKVAVASMSMIIRVEYTYSSEEMMAECAFKYADAFMVERSKRLNGNVK